MTGPGEHLDIEWVDADPPTPTDDVISTRAPRHPRWSWWYLIGAAVILAGVIVATRPSGHHPSASPSRSSSPSPSRPAGPTPSGSTPVAAGASPGSPSSVVVSNGSGPLLNVPASWDLFGRGTDSVIRIELAAGRITSTAIPVLSSAGAASFLVGPDRAIVRPLDVVDGYEVVDGQPSQQLPNNFPNFGPAFPGPDATHVWVPGPSNNAMILVGFDGKPTGVSINLPPPIDNGAVSSDDAGYLLFSGTGGVYDARPSGFTRITTGSLLAGGPTTWLVYECDQQYSCSTSVIDRATGARHPLKAAVTQFVQGGLIAPNGQTVAVLEGNQSQPVALHLINLSTGVDRTTTFTLDPNLDYQDGLFIWSPDSHYIFATNATGRVYAIDAPANQTVALNAVLGPVSQLALRTG